MKIARLGSFIAAAMFLTGCQAGNYPSAPVSGASASCEHSCNRDNDYCTDRYVTSTSGVHPDPASILGSDAVCTDALKSCLTRCAP